MEDQDDDFSAGFQKEFLPHVLSQLPEATALVLLFDEFDVLDNPGGNQAGTAFFPYLRELMRVDTGRLKFVFVIGRRPEDLSNIALALFKGIKSRHVSLLSPEDTADLARLSEKNDSLKWPDDLLVQLHAVTGGHSYLTQQICWVTWENIYDEWPDARGEGSEGVPVVRAEDVKGAVPEALDSAKNSLEWLWDGLGPAERVVASALAQAGPDVISQEELEQCLQESGVRILIGELQNAPRMLEDWDLIQPENGGYRIRVEMLRRWIVDRKPLSRVQDELDRVLPVAENLFQAAYGIYQSGDLGGATPLLQQAVNLNPNHLKASQLLAEIFLGQGNTGEALKLLETLYEYHPSAARPRLVQALIKQAKGEEQENERLAVYEKVLKIDPRQPEAIAEYQEIWGRRGDVAYKNNELDKALEAYEKADAKGRIEKVNKKFQLENLYQKALNALKENEKEKARRLLADIMSIDPSFKKAIHYMHLAVSDADVIELEGRIKNLESANRKLKKENSELQNKLEEKIKSIILGVFYIS